MNTRPKQARIARAPLSRTLLLEPLEDRCLLSVASAPPQILLTSSVLANLRQEAADNNPQWQAFKARLDSNLPVVIADDIGSYEGEQLAWISDYALGYQVLKDSDPLTAANYADKAIGLMNSGLHDYQKGSWVARQYLARGDGSTRTFTLPNADLLPSTLTVYLSPVVTDKVVHGSANGQDTVDYYLTYLKVSNTPDGPASYTEGTDWAQNPNYDDSEIDWSLPGKEPAVGTTYYVTSAGGLYGQATTAYTLNGSTINFAQAPARNQAVFVQYIYGTHSSDGSTLAYQQTSAGDGGFNSIFIDDTYASRYLGKSLAMGLDWLDGYVGMTQAFEQEVADMLVRWSDYIRDNGYFVNSPSSNYAAGAYASQVMTALALGPRTSDGPRLLSDVLAYRQTYILPELENPTTSLDGGFWVEGWNYGDNAVQALLLGSEALEVAGQITATPEHQWANEVVDNLASGQSAPGLEYDSGEVYQYPFHLLDRDLFFSLSVMCASPVEQSYANYVIQDYPDSAFGFDTPSDYRYLLFDDPAAPAAYWSALPLQNFASGTGLLTARSDWGPDPIWTAVQIGNQLPDTDHQFDPGQMEINRGADQLLINAYQVEHVYGSDSAEPYQISQFGNFVVVNDHGAYERTPPNMGTTFGTPGVVDNAVEGTDDFAYLYGDYHAAYSPDSDPGSGGPTSELTRQVVYVRPDLVFVFDRVTTLQASYTKQLRWHFANAPKVNGNSFVETAGTSKLFGQTFSTVPLTTSLSNFVVGSGSESFRVQQLDTQNVTPTTRVRYMTVFQVAPSTSASMDSSRHILSTNSSMEGAEIDGQVVLFGRDGNLAPDTVVTYSFDGSGAVQHLLTNLLPSQTYEVLTNGSVALVTSSDQGTLSFSTPSGVGTVTVMADRMVLTSPSSVTFTVGQNGKYTITASGYPIPSLTETGALPAGVTFTDNGNGTATLTGIPAFGSSGIYNLTINLHDGVLPDTSASFTLTAAFTNLLIDAPSQVVAGENFMATVEIVDAGGNLETAYNGSVALGIAAPAGATLGGVTRVPAQNGVATFSNLFVNATGTYTLFASSDSDLPGSTTTVTAIALPPATRFRVVAGSSGSKAGLPLTVTVTALGANGLVDSSFQGTIHFSSTDGKAGLPADYAFTPADQGSRMFSLVLKTAGQETITVVDTTRPTVRGTSSIVNVAAADIAGFSVTDFPSVDVIGISHPVIVTAVDAFNNRVRSYRGQVHLSVSGGSANLPQDYTFSTADAGSHTFPVTLTSLGGGQMLSATDTSDGSISGTRSNITVVSPATHFGVTLAPPTNTSAGQTFTLRVIALDGSNHPDGLFTDVLHFSSTDPQAVLPMDQAFAGTGGRETFSVILKTAGPQTITVVDTDRRTITGTSGRQTVTAGSASALRVSGFPSPTFAGASHTFSVTAVDSFGNRATTYRGQIQFAVSGGSANLPAPYTFTATDQGRRVFTADLDTVGVWSLTATDAANSSVAGEEDGIDVANLSAGISGPAGGVPGQPLSFTLTANEDAVSAGAIFTYGIDWDGNGRVDQVVTGINGLGITHAYRNSGSFTPIVTVTDSAGNISQPAPDSQEVSVQTVEMETDPADSSKTALVIGGTPGADIITITPSDSTGLFVSVTINGVVDSDGPFNPTGHIQVYGQGGNDVIKETVGTNAGQPVLVAVPALLFAGPGNSTLSVAGSSADNLLIGGSGNDSLTGGSGRDILIGGLGADTLHAGSGGDVLISGGTSHDANVTALLALMAEWSRMDIGYLQRVQDLFSGGSGALNGSVLLDPQSMTQDAAVNQVVGVSVMDWYWIAGAIKSADKLNGYTAGEVATFL